MADLSGKVAIVTGGAQGIGLGIARSLAQAGAGVMIGDSQAEKANSSAAALRQDGLLADAIACDVASGQAVAGLVEGTVLRFGRVDILVSVAGGSGHEALPMIEQTSEEVWDSVVAANLKGTFLCAKAVIPLMKAQRSGRIINFSSVAARGFGGSAATIGARLPYVAAKAGIEAVTRQLAHDLSGSGITCNCIVPGMVMTEPGARMHERFAVLDEEVRKGISALLHDDFASPADVGALALYLSSDAARHVNGQSLNIGVIG